MYKVHLASDQKNPKGNQIELTNWWLFQITFFKITFFVKGLMWMWKGYPWKFIKYKNSEKEEFRKQNNDSSNYLIKYLHSILLSPKKHDKIEKIHNFYSIIISLIRWKVETMIISLRYVSGDRRTIVFLLVHDFVMMIIVAMSSEHS